MNSHNTHSSVGGGREDCWSEGATAMLIEAWGDRFSRLDRGKLRQNDLQDVADPVNSRQNGVKPKKTDVYERIKGRKQHQMMELEKQRIEFTEDVEFQRMNMLVDAQLEMEKSKREKHFNCSGI
ncbi:hypothetical protein Gotri_000306 [Gossypium trilobum]|uniref:No apical meristem-associated C-terminal domain-containing protein n=1 Tax=Gossypium trilobum TaxID=34281 RepID=A0A7J9FAV8_9ROSI|nr:hypothetical protein [Gossypium trilobum]